MILKYTNLSDSIFLLFLIFLNIFNETDEFNNSLLSFPNNKLSISK